MQLKIKRSQREGGMVSKSVIFCVDARVEFTPEERQSITRYKLQKEVIYNSEAQLKLLAKSEAQQDGSFAGNLKSLATAAFAHTKLYITIGSLEQGQHIECKSLDELMGAEDAILSACQNLKGYLETAQTFDGREVLFDFATGAAEVVAQAVSPQPMLAAPATASVLSPPPSAMLAQPAQAPAPAASEAFDERSENSTEQSAAKFDAFLDQLVERPGKVVAGFAVGVLLLFLLLWSCSA